MHVILATDGSKQSLAAAKQLKSFADPTTITDVSVVAVISPLSAVPFVNELSGPRKRNAEELGGLSFRAEAQAAVDVVSAELAGWGPKIHGRLRSGSAAAEIIKTAKQLNAGLIVVASGGRGLSDTILLGSTATRVQHSAPCPVLVTRPVPRKPTKKS